MKKAISLIALVCAPIFWHANVVQAQKQGQELIDSLQTANAVAKNDTGKVNILNELSEHAGWRMGNHQKGQDYADEALHLSRTLNFRRGEAESYRNMGVLSFYQGKYPEALEAYTSGMEIMEEIGNRAGVAAATTNIGLVHYAQGNFPEAINRHAESLKIFRETGNKTGMASAHMNIGAVYQFQGNYPDALENYLASLKIYEVIDDKSNIAKAYGNIGNVYHLQKKYTEATNNFLNALDLLEETNDRRSMAIMYNNLGRVYEMRNNLTEASESYMEALKIFDEHGDKNGVGSVLWNLGNVESRQGGYATSLNRYYDALEIFDEIGNDYAAAGIQSNIGHAHLKLGNYGKARTYLENGLQEALSHGNEEIIKEYYQALALLDSTAGDWRGAYGNHKSYIQYRDILFNEETNKNLVQQQMNYEFEKKEDATRAEQEKKDAVVQEKIKRQRVVRDFSLTTVGGLMLFSLVVIRQRNKVKKEKKRSDDLLLNILPVEIAEELKEKGNSPSRQFDDVSVLFTDFVNFTKTAEGMTPHALVQELDACFTAFDHIIESNGLEKIKTIGDAYLAVCGLPLPDPNHAQKTVQAALEISRFIEERKKQERAFDIRIGIHSGSVVAGIVGIKKFAYDIWGDTVNTASRMESSGEAGKVNISGSTHRLVQNDFACLYRGELEAKGKGKVEMYFAEHATA